MKRIIGRKEYDTETATIIKKYTFGQFGDPDGYEEILYQTPDGFYFIYVNGGSMSDHPQEGIYRLSKAKLEEWLKNHK
ncbi:MAG: hypothetical protein IJA47_00160 [Oscillospiraceae bacterium]|nr:hypothetical protein [Oscillospiraceae bacterium]